MRSSSRGGAVIVFRIFIVISILMLCISVIFISHTNKLVKDGQKVTGEVVELEKIIRRATGKSRHASTTYRPVIKFKTVEGEEFTASTKSSSNPPSYSVGDKVSLYYDKDNPKSIMVDSFLDMWMGALICFAMSVIFGAAGIVIRRKSRKISDSGINI